MATGSYAYRDSFYGQRLILTLSRNGATVSYTLSLQSTGSMYASVSWSLSGGVSTSGTTNISQGAGFTQVLKSGSYTNNAANTVSASATMFWGGRPTVTASIGSGVKAPAAPTGLKVTRINSTDLTLSWTAAARASSYKVQRRENDGTWKTSKTGLTTTSHTMPNMPLNERHYLRVVAVNSAGSAYSASTTEPFYSAPAMPTNLKGQLTTSGYIFTLTNNAKYPYGIEIQLEGGDTYSSGSGTGGNVNSITITLPYDKNYRFRARAFAGPSDNRAYSNWTGYIDNITVGDPELTVTAFRVRNTSDVNEDPLGKTLRLIMSGVVPKLDTDTMTLTASYRIATDPEATQENPWGGTVTIYNSTDAGDFKKTSTLWAGLLSETLAYEVRVVLTTSKGGYAEKLVTIPVGEVSFSLAQKGAAVGRLYDEYGSTLQVGGSIDVDGDVDVQGNVYWPGKPRPIYAGSQGGHTIPGNITKDVPITIPDMQGQPYLPIATLRGDRGAVDRLVLTITNWSISNNTMTATVKNLTAKEALSTEWRVGWCLIPVNK